MILRLVILLIFVSPVVLATLWFSDNAGIVQVEWLGWRVDTNMPVLLGMLLAVFLVLSGLSRLSALVAELPAKLGKSRQARGREKGMSALLAALDAAEKGEVGDGRRLGAEAARLLNSPELAARLDRLLPRPPVPPTPLTPQPQKSKGRIFTKQPVTPPPPELVEKGTLVAKIPPVVNKPVAVPAAPTAPSEADVAAFAAMIRQGEWDAAQAWIGEAVPAGRLSPVVAARWRAVTLAGQALGEFPGDPVRSSRLAREAMAADHSFLPAILHVLRLEVSQGRREEAEAVLANAWRIAPDRVLLDACSPLWCDEDLDGRLKRLEALAEIVPHHPGGHLAAGEAAVAAQKWGIARRHLMAALKIVPDALGCRLMAEIEEREPGGSARAAEVWRRREREAPSEHGWVCGTCGAVTLEWSACCPACGGVATVEWTRPVKAIIPPAVEPAATPVEAASRAFSVRPESVGDSHGA
jgi:HemY protein